mgnify:CR=1 FL=1
MSDHKEFNWFDRPENIRKLWIFLYAACAGTVLSELLFMDATGHFGFDDFFGFYALLGFVSCAALILFAKLAGLFLKVGEKYYDGK